MEIEESSLGRLSRLFPRVDEKETPLPRSWSAKDKFSYIGLSQNNLRIHYKGKRTSLRSFGPTATLASRNWYPQWTGSGKNHKDAAAVRASHSIPTGCGIYYFEIRVLSKGRDGWAEGIVLSESQCSTGDLVCLSGTLVWGCHLLEWVLTSYQVLHYSSNLESPVIHCMLNTLCVFL